jgi:hypothetical protein
MNIPEDVLVCERRFKTILDTQLMRTTAYQLTRIKSTYSS